MRQTHNSPLLTGQYFGELALLDDNNVRHATVTSIGVTKLAFMERDSFALLMGPCKEIMERKRATYAGDEHRQ